MNIKQDRFSSTYPIPQSILKRWHERLPIFSKTVGGSEALLKRITFEHATTLLATAPEAPLDLFPLEEDHIASLLIQKKDLPKKITPELYPELNEFFSGSELNQVAVIPLYWPHKKLFGAIYLSVEEPLSLETYQIAKHLRLLFQADLKTLYFNKIINESEKKYRVLFESFNDAVILADKSGFIDCNETAMKLLGLTDRTEIKKASPFIFLPDQQPNGTDSREMAYTYIYQAITSGDTTFEWQQKHPDGTLYPAKLTFTAMQLGNRLVIQAIVKDLTHQKTFEEQLKKLPSTDPVTGILDQDQLNKDITEEIERIHRYGGSLSCVIFDIDHLGSLIDTYGQTIVDELLKFHAYTINKQLRRTDKFYRYRDEAFIIISPETDTKQVYMLAERLRQITENLTMDPVEQITISQGVTTLLPGDKKRQILERAIAAFYHSKKNGGNKVTIYSK